MNNVVTKHRLEKLKKLRLFDDDYAKIVFKDKECVCDVLNIILGYKIEVIHHETQRVLKVVGGRTIECDIFVLSKDKAINLELEKHSFRLRPQRVRYHASVTDTNVSKPSQDFDDMLDIIIIFVCEFDPIGYGYSTYHIRRYVYETKEEYNDGMEIILVNGTYSGDDEIGRLIHDLKCTNPDEMYSSVLREKTRYYKEDEQGGNYMCEAWEEERREGRLEGRLEGKLETLIASLKSLMKNTSMTLEVAMQTLELTDEEKQMCKERL